MWGELESGPAWVNFTRRSPKSRRFAGEVNLWTRAVSEVPLLCSVAAAAVAGREPLASFGALRALRAPALIKPASPPPPSLLLVGAVFVPLSVLCLSQVYLNKFFYPVCARSEVDGPHDHETWMDIQARRAAAVLACL